MTGLLSGLAAPAAGGGGRGRCVAALGGRGAGRADEGVERAVGTRAGARVAHEARGVHEAEADALALLGELLAVEVGAEVALLHGDAGGARDRVDPVAQVLNDEVPHGAGPVV